MVWWIKIGMREVVAMKPKTAMLNASGESPRCPRCGYDQTGATDWQTQCPLEGKCSECGLDFLWRDVLHPRFNVPKWCVEFGPYWSIPMRTVRTMLMMLRPWRFWRELQMHHELRRSRIALMLMMALVVVGWASFSFSAGYSTWQVAGYSATVGARSTPAWVEGLQAAAMPFWFKTSTVYGPMPQTPISRFRPTRIASAGWHAIRYGVVPLAWDDRVNGIAERAFLILCSLIMCPIGFVLLPISRRMAKVRWAHIQRIALYSVAFALPAVAIDVFDQLVVTRYQWRGELSAAMLAGTAGLLVLWWAMAARGYLRMRHAWLVGMYVVAFGYLSQYFIFQCIDLALALS